MFCSNCGNKLEDGANLCSNCGNSGISMRSGENRNTLFPEEEKAIRKLQEVLKDLGVNSVLEVKPFTTETQKYSAIFHNRQLCTIHLGYHTEKLTYIKNSNVYKGRGPGIFSKEIQKPDDISSPEIKDWLKGILDAGI